MFEHYIGFLDLVLVKLVSKDVIAGLLELRPCKFREPESLLCVTDEVECTMVILFKYAVNSLQILE